MKKEKLVKKILSLLCAALLVGAVVFRGISPMITLSAYATGVESENLPASSIESLPVSGAEDQPASTEGLPVSGTESEPEKAESQSENAESQLAGMANQGDSQSAASLPVLAEAPKEEAGAEQQGAAPQFSPAPKGASGTVEVVCNNLEDAWDGQPVAASPVLYLLDGAEATYDNLTPETKLLEIKVDGYKAANVAVSVTESGGTKTVTFPEKVGLIPAYNVAWGTAGVTWRSAGGKSDGAISFSGVEIETTGTNKTYSYRYALENITDPANPKMGTLQGSTDFSGLADGDYRLVVFAGAIGETVVEKCEFSVYMTCIELNYPQIGTTIIFLCEADEEYVFDTKYAPPVTYSRGNIVKGTWRLFSKNDDLLVQETNAGSGVYRVSLRSGVSSNMRVEVLAKFIPEQYTSDNCTYPVLNSSEEKRLFLIDVALGAPLITVTNPAGNSVDSGTPQYLNKNAARTYGFEIKAQQISGSDFPILIPESDVKISLYKDGSDTGIGVTSGNLETVDGGKSYSGKVTLPAGLKDGKYRLDITAIDSIGKNDSVEGHETTHSISLVIDEAPPAITVDYCGETPGGSQPNILDNQYYFKENVVLSVAIKDENCSDAPDAVKITLQHNGTEISPVWQITDTADGKTYSTVLTGDGVYQVTGVTAEDLAGNSGEATGADTQKSAVIDTEKPKLSIGGAEASRFYTEDKTITLTVTDTNLTEDELNRADSPYSKIEVSGAKTGEYTEGNWTPVGGEFTKTIEFEKDGCYSVNAVVTDFAGNRSGAVGVDDFTVDKTLPKLTVEYSSSSKAWNDNYFNATRSLVFTVEERNFVPGTAIELRKTLPSGESSIVKIGGWTSSGDTHTASYDADEDALYELVSLKITDKAGNSNGANGEIVEYKGAQTEKNRAAFYVDKTMPAGTITAAKGENKTVWDKLVSLITFGLVNKTSIEVELRGADTSSGHPFTGIDRIEYIKTAQPIGGENDNPQALQALLEARTDWTTRKFNNQNGGAQNAAFTIIHDEDEGFYYYMRVYDLAENVYYLNSEGMIVDTQAVLESVVPVVTVGVQPVNGIYNGDVGVDIKVTDPEKGGICSGIAKVEYQVLNIGAETQAAELFNFDTENYPSVTAGQIKQNQKFETRIIVDAAKNNSNDVQVRVTAYDRAGNVTFSDVRLRIDITAPTIAVRYDNNDVKNGKYFNAPRTATITINERNFDPDSTVIDTNGTVGAWQEVSAGTGNQDDRAYSASVTFASSADYTLAVRTADLAGNKGGEVNFGGSAAPESFTVDLVKPVITVTYDNNDVRNERYYNRSRTATVHIQEHNFSVDGASVSVAASLNGVSVAAPAISGWSRSGDGNTATIYYQADADYTFDISCTDLAGNTADAFETQNFTVDTTPPVISISGVDMRTAYNGDVMPVVRFEDLNLDAENSTVGFEGVKNGEIAYGGSNADTAQTRTFTSANFPAEPKVDDVYTLSSKVVDKAGNEMSESLMFSVNRFGSTYILHQNTASEIENTYIQAAPQVIITEINVNRLVTQQASYTHNGNTVMLEREKNYVFNEAGDDASWKEYVYTIDAANFEAEGMYSVTLLSTDEAENTSSNRATKVKGSELLVDFVVDRTPPSVILTGVEKNGRYNDASRLVSIDSEDNLAMDTVAVYLNGQNTPVASYTAQQIQDAGGVLQYKWNGQNTRQSLRVVATDRAGNRYEVGVDNVLISGDWFVQYVNNIPLLVGSIGSVLLLLILVVFVTRKKRANQED